MSNGSVLLGCSPRKKGNSDTAMQAWADEFTDAEPIYLRSEHILPCIACGLCGTFALASKKEEDFYHKDKENECDLTAASDELPQDSASKSLQFGCPLTCKDDSSRLLSRLYEASSLCIVSPMYFYFFPAQVKSLLDRLQPFWELQSQEKVRQKPKKFCYSILISGRPRGEKLFEGSLLSLKYALSTLGFTLAEPLLLRGYDQKTDLASDANALLKIKEYARVAKQQTQRQ